MLRMYKCEDCGMLSSENLFVCPKCNSEKNKLVTDVYDELEMVYVLTMEDVENVMDNIIDEDLANKLKDISRDTIKDVMNHKLDIPYGEYIEALLDAKFN